MKALVTGFEPFGDDPINPARDALDRLAHILLEQEVVDGDEVRRIVTPEPVAPTPA